MFANLKLAPTLPLFFPVTVLWLWLWLFWRYVRGDGWPGINFKRRAEGRIRQRSAVGLCLAGLAIALGRSRGDLGVPTACEGNGA